MGVWRESGYADFADGTFGNGGQNIYVSRAGVLQRIFRFDLNRDGYTDLLFVNSQDMNERPPVYVVKDPLGALEVTELPTQGAYWAAAADLNGDGYDDLVIANQHNGTHSDVTAFVYYGAPGGLSERLKIELPAPNARAVCIGDFNGDGLPDLAFSSDGRLRVFYQTEAGFPPGEFIDLDLEITHMCADDLDGDGCADLYARLLDGNPCVLWGGPGGLDPGRRSDVGGADESAQELHTTTSGRLAVASTWAPKIVFLGGTPHLFRPEGHEASFYPARPDRKLGRPLRLKCDHAVSADASDVNGDGHEDIALAVCDNPNETESSWIYWGAGQGFSNARRTPLRTTSARDVVLGDLDGNGCLDVVICQGGTDVLHTTDSLIFRACEQGVEPAPLRVTTHGANTALVARTSARDNPEVIFVNHMAGRVRGDVSAYVYYGGPDGFSPEGRAELPGWSAPDALCCDFNDDGWPDVLLCNCGENAPHLRLGSCIYWGGPDGFDADKRTVLPTIRAHGSAVGDFRRCGYLDLAVAGFANPELRVFPGGPDGIDLEDFQRILLDRSLKAYDPSQGFNPDENQKGAAFREPRWLLAADFNKDGWLDLFVSQIVGPCCLILWGGPDGFTMDRASWLAAEGTSCAQAADLTGDGWLDLIVAGHQSRSKRWKFESYVYIYWGGPDGFREDRRTQLPAHTCNSLTIADFDNDGVLDIFATSYNSGRERDLDSYIYWGAPGGVYSAGNCTRLFTHSASGCLAADFNEDGWVDLAVANHKTYGNHTGHSQVWWNGPEGFSEKRVTLLPTMGPHGMVPVDPGNIMDRGPAEYYVSSPFELPLGATVTTIRWEAEIQNKTRVRAQLRFAPTRHALSGAPWQGPNAGGGWFGSGDPARGIRHTGRWIQYRLALEAVNGGNSPRVASVEVEYG